MTIRTNDNSATGKTVKPTVPAPTPARSMASAPTTTKASLVFVLGTVARAA